MEFKINNSKKLGIKKKRFRYERKWGYLRNIYRILNTIAIILPLWGYFDIYYLGNHGFSDTEDTFRIIYGFVIPAFLSLAVRTVGSNVTSQWVTNLFNESLQVENGTMIRAFTKELGAGAMSFTEGIDRYISIIDIDSIHELKINEKTKRIEFRCNERTVDYSDWKRKIVNFDVQQVGVKIVFYDYYEPSMIEYMKSLDIPYVEGDMDYKMDDTPEHYKGAQGGKRLQEDLKAGKTIYYKQNLEEKN